MAYSVLASCELADVEPMAYLTDVMPRLSRDTFSATDIRALLPDAWGASRKS